MTHPSRVFDHYLLQLQHILDVIQQQFGDEILDVRLHPSMLPLKNQVRATANFALRGCCPLAGKIVFNFDALSEPASLASLNSQVDKTRLAIQEMVFDNLDKDAVLTEKAGFALAQLPADDFIALYILPNFFFHLNMVYAIARQAGVSLSKQDYDGIHGYPAGFSFES